MMGAFQWIKFLFFSLPVQNADTRLSNTIVDMHKPCHPLPNILSPKRRFVLCKLLNFNVYAILKVFLEPCQSPS